MEYGASAEDVARVCHAHPVSLLNNYNYQSVKLIIIFRHVPRPSERRTWPLILENQLTSKHKEMQMYHKKRYVKKKS